MQAGDPARLTLFGFAGHEVRDMEFTSRMWRVSLISGFLHKYLQLRRSLPPTSGMPALATARPFRWHE